MQSKEKKKKEIQCHLTKMVVIIACSFDMKTRYIKNVEIIYSDLLPYYFSITDDSFMNLKSILPYAILFFF